jgi:phospholipid transport system substrate-binding protein
MNRRIILAALLILPVVGISAASSSEEAQQRLHAAIDQVLGIAERSSSQAALVEKVAPVLEKNISFVAMTRRAVGPGWRDFNGDQQKKAVSLFTKLVIRSYCNKFTLGEHPKIEYKSAVSPAAGRVDVTTTTIYKGNRYGVVYRMEQEDGWRATDIVIEGVSMVANYRSQFDPVFKKGGVEAVLSSLEQSVARQK